MKQFEAILNAEIVESGRIPDARVIARTKELADMLETHYADRNILTPTVSPHYDVISFGSELTDDSGFTLQVSLKKEDNTIEEELIVWHKDENIFINVKGTLGIRDFEYSLNRHKEYLYLDSDV